MCVGVVYIYVLCVSVSVCVCLFICGLYCVSVISLALNVVWICLFTFNRYWLECPAEFRVTEFRRNFAEFFPGIPPEFSYGIPYICGIPYIRNSAMRNFVFYGIPQCGIPFIRNSVTYEIP